MSLLDKASLVVTPNAYKESKLYSVIPNTTLGDMDVVRATTATRINSSGLIEVVPRNLFSYSEQFDDASWAKANMVVVANNTISPNGTNTADKATASLYPSTSLTKTNLVNAQSYTNSIYVKADTVSTFRIDFVTAGFALGSNCIFNLTTLSTTITNYGATSGSTATITNVGNGWYRCTLTVLATSANYFSQFYPAANGSVFIWGAQLEAFPSATEYFPTTTRLNIPRIDYTNGSCPSLLVEPQRTNLQLNSEDFSNASWVKTLSAVVVNQIASPSGNVDADKLNETATTGNHQLESSRNASIAAYSMSVFAKKAEREWLYLFEDTTGKGAYFNLNNGTIGTIAAGATAKIESFGNGWYRCSVTYNESGTFGRYRIAVTTGNGVTSYTGVANNGIYIWGAQYELGAYATSYIPTIASSVTRNADSISKTGISSLIGQTEGTAFIECTADTTNPNGAMLLYLGSSDGSGAFNYSTYLKFSSTSLNLAVYSGGTSYVDSTSSQTYTNKQNIKVAISYKNNDFVCYANGVQLFTDTTGVVSTNLSTLSLGYYPPNIPYNQYNGNIKSVQLYKTRLTNAELAQLTTL